MGLTFASRTLPSRKIKINGKIKKAIDAYMNRKVPMSLLLTNFLAVKSKGDRLAKAENPWAYFYRGQGHEVESGVSVDESLFRFATMEIKNQKPTDVINAAFFANKTRNDADFELGYLLPEFTNELNPSTNIMLVNPSPDMISDIEGMNLKCKRFYAVPDDTVAGLYRIQFPESKFVTFEKMDEVQDIGALLITNRDQKVENAALLLQCLSCCNESATVLALVPSAWFDNANSGAYLALTNAEMSIEQMLIVDTGATVTTPRKKVLLSLKKGIITSIEVRQSEFDSKTRVFSVLDKRVEIKSDDYLKSQRTILSYWKLYTLPTIKLEEVKYQKAEEYAFSKEISVFYKIYSDRKNKNAGVAYYRELKSIQPIIWGRKISEDVEKGLRAESKELVLKKIEEIVFEDALYSIIRRDVSQKYIEAGAVISLKTIWFYTWLYLQEMQKYDHEYISQFMRSEQVANYVPLLQTGADLLDALAKTLKVEIEDIPYKAVEQFGLVFAIAVKRGILVHNPVEGYVNEYSRRATGRQQDVRNALVKKHFSWEEESKIFAAITENVTINKKDLPRCVTKSLLLATVIRLFTGMAIREVAALRWADFVSIDGTESYQFTITKFVDSKGKIILHAERENWKRFRVVPVVEVVAILLLQRKSYLLEMGIDERYLDECPIVLQEEYIEDMKRQKRISHTKPTVISRSETELIKKANIPENNLVLPDEVNELRTDFNRYHGDIFLSNFRHKANHEAYLTMGEINYMIGINAPDTLSQYYCDYSNDFKQESMIQKLRRWGWSHEKRIKKNRLTEPKYGKNQGACSLIVGPYANGNTAIDIIMDNASSLVSKFMAECLHGLLINKTTYGGK